MAGQPERHGVALLSLLVEAETAAYETGVGFHIVDLVVLSFVATANAVVVYCEGNHLINGRKPHQHLADLGCWTMWLSA